MAIGWKVTSVRSIVADSSGKRANNDRPTPLDSTAGVTVARPRTTFAFGANVQQTPELKDQLDETTAAYEQQQRKVAELLTRKWSISQRDAGDLLDLSHQRVGQILKDDPKTGV